MRFSLLHATWRRPGGPLEVRAAWLARADHPDLVEHVFAIDDDDHVAIQETEGDLRVISEATAQVTAVRNWNAAAALSSGDVLVVIADDLFPPPGWDTTLTRIIEPFDPTTEAFAIKVSDSPDPANTLLRHPVVSRAYYAQHGLFTPEFTGVYCDDDITRRAFWRAVILDGRALVLHHRHPTLMPEDVGFTESHLRLNADQEYERGEALFRSLWSRRHRDTAVLLISPRWRNRLPLRYLRFALVAGASSKYALGRLAAGFRLALQPRRLMRRLQESELRRG